MIPHTVCCPAPSQRWPSASAATARVEIIVMPWTMPMLVTATAVRTRAITPTTRIDCTGLLPRHRHITSQPCARPQSP